MKKFKYHVNEIGMITHILQKNNVKFEFEKPQDFYNCLEELAPTIYKSYDRWIKSQKSAGRALDNSVHLC
jgi:hypothetical protein